MVLASTLLQTADPKEMRAVLRALRYRLRARGLPDPVLFYVDKSVGMSGERRGGESCR